MKYKTTLKRLIDGGWLARTVGSSVGTLEVTGDSREAALDRLRAEIRYRVEWCPCSAVAEDYVELDVQDLEPSRFNGSVF